MSKTRHVFHPPPWPLPVQEDENTAVRRELYGAFRDLKLRMQAFRQSPVAAKHLATYRRARADFRELSAIAFQEEYALTHIRLLREARRDATACGVDVQAAVEDLVDALGAVSMLIWHMDGMMAASVVSGFVLDKDEVQKAIGLAQQCLPLARDDLADSQPAEDFDRLAAMLHGRDWLALFEKVDPDLEFLAVHPAGDANLDEAEGSAEEDIRAWRSERNLAKARFVRISKRIEKWRSDMLVPYVEAIKARVLSARPLDDILLDIQGSRYDAELQSIPRRFSRNAGDYDSFLPSLGSSWEFWYLALNQILIEHSGITGTQFAPWVLPLLSDLIHHPRKLTRLPAPQPAQKARTALAKRVAPFIQGSALGPDAQRMTVSRLQALEPSAALQAIAQYIADTRLGRDSDSIDRDEWVEELWDDYFSPHLEQVIESIAPPVNPGEAVQPIDVIDLLAQWETEDKKPAGVQPDEVIEVETETGVAEVALPHEPVVAEPPPAPIRWFYVHEPARADLDRIEIPIDENGREVALGKFLRQEDVDPVVKPTSIVSALDHYCRMPPKVRALLPHDIVGGNPWSKLKRGPLRIYVRFTPAGDLLFHLYHRRLWDQRVR